MPKTIYTPEPNTQLSYQGENYTSDDQGAVTLPDSAAKHFIESHGCTDPTMAHPYGLKIKSQGRGNFSVVDADDKPIHGGYLDHAAAHAVMRSYVPPVVEGESEADAAPAKKSGKKNA